MPATSPPGRSSSTCAPATRRTNGVVERWFQSLKYEHLYRHELDDGPDLAAQIERFLDVYNTRRPHEALDFALPIDRYLRPPTITPQPAIKLGHC